MQPLYSLISHSSTIRATSIIDQIDEAPNLVELKPLARKLSQRPVLVFGTGRASISQELDDGVLAGARQPGD